MSHTIQFKKMQGLGNDFVVIDNITQPIRLDPPLVRKIADRQHGIGCDQILLVEAPLEPTLDFNYRIYNADGKEVYQCGNGARCFGRYVYEQGLTDKKQLRVGTHQGLLHIDIQDLRHICVNLGKPIFSPKRIPLFVKAVTPLEREGLYKLSVLGNQVAVSILSMGNPHCVLIVPSITEAHVNEIGAALQKHPAFPKGVNVGFMQVLARNHVRLRVFERGVGETLACGSGACAAVVAGILNEQLSREVKVDMKGGALTVAWSQDGDVMQTGPAHSVFQGSFLISMPERN